ncbi:hypothetical protein CA13_63820 [Planctomycetes bacterium CA13]|uniref:Uncharacterized protein n=1 Tax=Novipirellula herctigrandis TaxID=2527986 RepID=A0A5C5ZDJ1_9BACT|nr:hypothetical protein CA13_63820 [Planctomycetes bacterium CA13]
MPTTKRPNEVGRTEGALRMHLVKAMRRQNSVSIHPDGCTHFSERFTTDWKTTHSTSSAWAECQLLALDHLPVLVRHHGKAWPIGTLPTNAPFAFASPQHRYCNSMAPLFPTAEERSKIRSQSR